MKLLILFTVFLSTVTFAGTTTPDPNTEWFIYVYNDVGTMADAMRFLSSVNHNGSYQNILYLAIVFGLFSSIFIKKFFDPSTTVIQIGSTIALMAFLFGARTDVNIVNVKTYKSVQTSSSYARVADVPFAFALTASTLSTIGYSMAKLVNEGIGSIQSGSFDEISFLKTGAIGGSNLFNKMLKTNFNAFGSKAKSLDAYYKSYFKECIIKNAMKYSDKTRTCIAESTDIIEDVSPAKLKTCADTDISDVYVNFYTGQKMTCQDAWELTKQEYDAFKSSPEIEDYYKKYYEKKLAEPIKALGSTLEIYAGADNASTSANKIKDFTLSYGLINASNKTLQNYINNGTTSTAADYGAFTSGTADASLLSTSLTKAYYSAQQLPNYMTILNFVMYILFPFVFVVTIASAQLKILKNFLLAMLWIQLWPATFEALSYFINKDFVQAATESLISAGGMAHTNSNLLTLDNYKDLVQDVAFQSAQAANLLWSVPVISGFILSGSWMSIMGMASQISGYASKGTDANSVQKEQADLANEKRLREMSNDRWSPTAGDMSRMEMDSQLAHSSGKIMSEIENLGFSGVSGVDRAKGDFETQKDLSMYARLNGTDGANSGYTAAVQTQTSNATMFETVKKMGGLDNYIGRTSDSESWKQFSSVSKNIGAESGFEQLYQKYGEGRTREGFYDYINTQAGRQEITNSLGGAIVTSGKNDNELVDIGKGSARSTNIAAQTTNETVAAIGEDTFVHSGAQSNIKQSGEMQGFEKIAQHYGTSTDQLAKTFSEYDNAVKMFDMNTMKSIAEKVTGKEGMAGWSEFQNMRSSANVGYVDKNGTHTVSYDKDLNNVNSTTDASQIYHKDNIMTEKTLTDISKTINKDDIYSAKFVTDTSKTINKDNIYSAKDVTDTSILKNSETAYKTGLTYEGASTMLTNKEYRKASDSGDVGRMNEILAQSAGINVAASAASLSGLAKLFGDSAQLLDIYAEKYHIYEKAQNSVSMFTDAYMKNAKSFVTDHGPDGGSGQTPGSWNYIKPADRK